MFRRLSQRSLFGGVLLVAMAWCSCASSQTAQPAETLDKMEWWRHDRFGMFIHWGLYAIPAGQYKGQPVSGTAEWIMNNANIPRAEYERFAKQFNPTEYDPDGWVQIAKQAGMKYIVITAKHHDGFSLFDSYGEYDSVHASPYGKDILATLSEACQRHDIEFCTYYSIMDWHHPAQLPSKEANGKPVWNPTKIDPKQKQAYIDYMQRHLRVLVEDYHTHVLWFDGEWPDWWTDADGQKLYKWLIELNPQLIVNNRIGAGRKGMAGFTQAGSFAGDFGTPEQEIPATGVDVDWESCMTMNRTWGYSSTDEDWKSGPELIHNLIDIASKGGNYLLNVGPKADGTFPQESIDRLQEIGKWMHLNGESIYGTTAAIFRPEWGRVTCKEGHLYLHVFQWPTDGKLVMPALANSLNKASLLAASKVSFVVETGPQEWVIDVPGNKTNATPIVIVLEVDGMPKLAKP